VDGTKRLAVGSIEPNSPNTVGPVTITAYRLDNVDILVTVKKADGTPETRRYRWGGNGWERY
jgi:hypothetical protein